MGFTSFAAPLAQVADTGPGGYTLINGTGQLPGMSWTAPNDGRDHTVIVGLSLNVSSAATGGALGYTYTDPGGNVHASFQILGGGQAAGAHLLGFTTVVVQAGTTFSLQQTSALTAGAAVAWATLWAS